MADNLLGLVHKIASEKFPPIPEQYSSELNELITKMLQKESEHRPTTSNILDMPLIEKYMKKFIQSKELIMKDLNKSKINNDQKSNFKQADISKKSEIEEPVLTPKQRLIKKKEEEAKRKFEEMVIAAKEAGKKLAGYN